MSEQEENNGTEEQAPVINLTPEELGDVANEGTDTEAMDVTLLGKVVNKLGTAVEVTDAIASTGADWVKTPAKSIGADSEEEFDIQMTITEGDELTGTLHLSGGIDLYFDMNGEDNHAHSCQRELGVMVEAEISRGPHAMATWTLSASPTE